MEEQLACPQCGNPQLDVDAQNSVVYCRRCGFAVRVDPRTGEVTPLQQPTPQGVPPTVYRTSEKTIFGMDPLTFLLGGTALLLLLTFIYNWDTTIFAILEVILFVLWWFLKK